MAICRHGACALIALLTAGCVGDEIDADPIARDEPPLAILVVNEVAAAGVPDDWFEVVNLSDAPVDIADFVFVDALEELDRARALSPDVTLRPGERHVQVVSKATSGFRLGRDEGLWIYRARDGRLSDGVDWAEGDAPDGGSFARVPDAIGDFRTSVRPTRGAAND